MLVSQQSLRCKDKTKYKKQRNKIGFFNILTTLKQDNAKTAYRIQQAADCINFSPQRCPPEHRAGEAARMRRK
jgi:hypothetical protein